MSNFFKRPKIMVFEILTFYFYLDEKRQPLTTVYMNASTIIIKKMNELVQLKSVQQN